MTKLKFLSITSILLLVANLMLVGFLVAHGPHPEKREPKEVIIKALQLDKNQVVEYQKLIAWHRQHLEPLLQQMGALKNQLYSSLQDTQAAASNDSLIVEIGKVQMEMERVHCQHFRDIGKLCRPEQLPAFDALCSRISKLFDHHERP